MMLQKKILFFFALILSCKSTKPEIKFRSLFNIRETLAHSPKLCSFAKQHKGKLAIIIGALLSYGGWKAWQWYKKKSDSKKSNPEGSSLAKWGYIKENNSSPTEKQKKPIPAQKTPLQSLQKEEVQKVENTLAEEVAVYQQSSASPFSSPAEKTLETPAQKTLRALQGITCGKIYPTSGERLFSYEERFNEVFEENIIPGQPLKGIFSALEYIDMLILYNYIQEKIKNLKDQPLALGTFARMNKDGSFSSYELLLVPGNTGRFRLRLVGEIDENGKPKWFCDYQYRWTGIAEFDEESFKPHEMRGIYKWLFYQTRKQGEHSPGAALALALATLGSVKKKEKSLTDEKGNLLPESLEQSQSENFILSLLNKTDTKANQYLEEEIKKYIEQEGKGKEVAEKDDPYTQRIYLNAESKQKESCFNEENNNHRQKEIKASNVRAQALRTKYS